MDNIPEPIRGKLAYAGCTSINQLPNNDPNNMSHWDRLQSKCYLTKPELAQLMNIRFSQRTWWEWIWGVFITRGSNFQSHTPLPEPHFSIHVKDIPPVALSPNACQQLIGAMETVECIHHQIDETIGTATDTYLRKIPILISRCPRGGKTTILELLHRRLQSCGVHVMAVSFNGVSGFLRVPGESPSESLFRLMSNQLDLGIDRQSPRAVNWDALDAHIGGEQFVLLIDEINVLCSTVGSELVGVLKKYFLDKRNRHLVVTSHQPFLNIVSGDDAGVDVVPKLWSDSVAALSERSLKYVPMPLCDDVPRLISMNKVRCSKITYSLAAFYGFMPSLMYAVCMQWEESPSNKFGRVIPGTSDDWKQLHDFVLALITGIPYQSLHRFFCFCSAVEFSKPLGIRIKWPLCYVACIFRHFPRRKIYEYIAECIDTLGNDCSVCGDGMVWEQSIRIAVLLRFIAAAEQRWSPPFELCSADEASGADVKVLHLGPTVIKMDQVMQVIYAHQANFKRNTLVLYVPTEAALEQFDGFCVRYQDNEVRNVCGYQYKDNNRGANGLVPEWITQGGHLLRSDAPNKCKLSGPNENRWTYYNAADTDKFLGWSLRPMRRERSS